MRLMRGWIYAGNAQFNAALQHGFVPFGPAEGEWVSREFNGLPHCGIESDISKNKK